MTTPNSKFINFLVIFCLRLTSSWWFNGALILLLIWASKSTENRLLKRPHKRFRLYTPLADSLMLKFLKNVKFRLNSSSIGFEIFARLVVSSRKNDQESPENWVTEEIGNFLHSLGPTLECRQVGSVVRGFGTGLASHLDG